MNSSTSSFKRWLVVFFVLVLGAAIPALAASEWMLRTYVLPVDAFESLARKLRTSSIPNAAFGDSHTAAVYHFDSKDFVNLGLGGATIRQMSDRVHFYFRKLKPGQVIIEADSHLFAAYRLTETYTPESYTSWRLAVFDERHRGYMTAYWTRFLTTGLKVKEKSQPPAQEVKDAPKNTKAPAAAESPKTQSVPPKEDAAFMEVQIRTQTPVADFEQRAEARIYVEMIDYLISRGATVCLMTFPVDQFYRKRADKLPTFAAVRDFYAKLASEKGIRYVSFWSRFNDQALFQNTDHVNMAGSAVLAPEARKACFSDK